MKKLVLEGFKMLPFDNHSGNSLEMALDLSMEDIGIPVLLNLDIEAKNDSSN